MGRRASLRVWEACRSIGTAAVTLSCVVLCIFERLELYALGGGQNVPAQMPLHAVQDPAPHVDPTQPAVEYVLLADSASELDA